MQSLHCTPPFLILLQIKHTTHLFLKLSIPVRRGRKIRGAIDHNHPCHTFTPLVPLSSSTATPIIHLHILNHPLSHPTIPYHPSSHPHYRVTLSHLNYCHHTLTIHHHALASFPGSCLGTRLHHALTINLHTLTMLVSSPLLPSPHGQPGMPSPSSPPDTPPHSPLLA